MGPHHTHILLDVFGKKAILSSLFKVAFERLMNI